MEKTNTVLPCTINSDVEYLPKLAELLITYAECVRKEPNLSDVVAIVENSANAIIYAIELYYQGKVADAYNAIIGMDYFSPLNKNQYIRTISSICNGTEHKTLYRGRCSKESLLDIKEMFHRPFSQREYVCTERYSVPGLPCLYLAGSVYTCWKEIGRPTYDDFYISRFEAEDNLQILDLAMHPRDCVIGEYDNKLYCAMWPLICACSIKVKEPGRIFKSEYIIPQLLMQFCISSDEIDGIRYLSVNQPQKCIGFASPLYVNYAFPAPYENEKKYSKKLAEKFKITSAVCLQEYGQLSAANIHTVTHWGNANNKPYEIDEKYKNSQRRNGAIQLCMDRFTEYAHTTYFDIEDFLYKFEAKEIIL